MSAKYTVTPSSTLPQMPYISILAARAIARNSSLSPVNAVALAGQIFDQVGRDGWTGNNQLSMTEMALELYQLDPTCQSIVLAIAKANALQTIASAVQTGHD